jgi:hypothetical protein
MVSRRAQRWFVGRLSVWLICLTLRAWGRCLISTERARSINTAIMSWAIRAAE